MKKLFKNVIFACLFALCCVFAFFCTNSLSLKVNAIENENQENEEVVENEEKEENPPIEECEHIEIVVEGYEPTCQKEGLSWSVKCKLCNEILMKPEVLPKIDHTYNEWVVIKEATKDECGLKEGYCTMCNEREIIEFDYVAPDYNEIGTYTMTLKSTELATLTLYDNNTCQITINKLDNSIFKIELSYQVVEPYIVLFSEDGTQEYLILVDEETKTFAPQLTEEQKEPNYWSELIVTLLVSFLGSGGLLALIKLIVGKWVKTKQDELQVKLDKMEQDKQISTEQKEETMKQFENLKVLFNQVLEKNTQLIKYIESKIEVDEQKVKQTTKLLESLLPNLENNPDKQELEGENE